jgi:hypothetical protein
MNSIIEKKLKFNENLLFASQSTDLEGAKKEWFRLETFSFASKCLQCICKRPVMNAHYMYNIYNQKVIVCGAVCSTKCNFTTSYLPNEILRKTLTTLIKPNINKSEEIDMDSYIALVKSSLLSQLELEYETIMKEHQYSGYCIGKLVNLSGTILELEKYNYKCFDNIKIQIKKQINNLLKERKKEKEINLLKSILKEWHKISQNKMCKYVESLKEIVNFGKYKNKTYGELCIDTNYAIFMIKKLNETKEEFQKQNIMNIESILKNRKYKQINRLITSNVNGIIYKNYNVIKSIKSL